MIHGTPNPLFTETEEDRKRKLMLLCTTMIEEIFESHERVARGESPEIITTPTHPIGLSLEEKLCMLMRDVGELSSAVMHFAERKIHYDGAKNPTPMPRLEYDEHKNRIQKSLVFLGAHVLGFQESIVRWNTIGARTDVGPDPDPGPLDSIVLIDDPRNQSDPNDPQSSN
jgi:hypothetical protein